MKKNNIYIISHFCSLNLGDRFQGRVFADIYGDKSNITYINFNDMPIQYDINHNGIKYEITSPKNIEIINCDVAIFLVGSFNGNAKYIPFMKQIIDERPCCKIIIWGGFTCVNDRKDDDTYFKNLDIFKNKNIFFFGRGYAELELYDKITDGNFINNRRLAGDPLVYYTKNYDISIKKKNNDNDNLYPMVNHVKRILSGCFLSKINNVQIKKAYISSIYFYKNYPDFFNYLVKNCDVVISIDPYDDILIHNDIRNNFPDRELIITNNPTDLLKSIEKYDLIVTNRLHGGILSLSINIQTIFIPSDNATSFENSFKYHSVGLTGAGKNKQICKIFNENFQNYKKIFDFTIENNTSTFYDNVLIFRELTDKTLHDLKILIN